MLRDQLSIRLLRTKENFRALQVIYKPTYSSLTNLSVFTAKLSKGRGNLSNSAFLSPSTEIRTLEIIENQRCEVISFLSSYTSPTEQVFKYKLRQSLYHFSAQTTQSFKYYPNHLTLLFCTLVFQKYYHNKSEYFLENITVQKGDSKHE